MKNTSSPIIDAILRRKTPFLLAFFVIFTLSYGTLAWLDFLPEPKKAVVIEEKKEEVNLESEVKTIEIETIADLEETEEATGPAILPKSISIDSLGRTIKVLNSTSHKVEDLDADLLKGVVRHPDSAALNQNGTVFILGHSSYLPAVKNPNFQAFNGIQNLKWGDTITVFATEGEFVYRVDRVYKANAKDHVVPIAGDSMKLVIATCNSFGSSDDRYIVEADLVKKTLY